MLVKNIFIIIKEKTIKIAKFITKKKLNFYFKHLLNFIKLRKSFYKIKILD